MSRGYRGDEILPMYTVVFNVFCFRSYHPPPKTKILQR